MRKCIAALAKVGQIVQIHDGRWLFKALLAAKPHQEHVSNINDFVFALLRKLYSTQPSDQADCLPHSRVRYGRGHGVWFKQVLMDV